MPGGKKQPKLDTIHEETPASVDEPQRNSELYSKLPKLEVCAYVGWSIYVWYLMISSVYQSSERYASALSSPLLLPGWQILGGRNQDVADVEWRFWKMTANSQFLFMVLGYVVAMRITERFIHLYRELIWTFLSLAFLTVFYEWQLTAMLIVYIVISFLASRSRSVTIVWIVSLIQLCSLYVEPVSSVIRLYFGFPYLEHAKFYTAVCIVKLLSFSLECCNVDNLPVCPLTKRTQDSLFDVLSYALYLPFIFTGPCSTYDRFRMQMNRAIQPLNKDMLWRFSSEFIRYTAYLLATEFCLHFLYVPALAYRRDILQDESFATLSAVIFFSLIFFQLKYLIFYGFPRAIALLDGFDAPLPPVCVIGLYSFRDMWKYFDRGLHHFVIRYIFIPLGGSRHGLFRNTVAAAATFSFVFFWHGPQLFVLYWAILNWIGVVLEVMTEKFGRAISANSKVSWFSGAGYRRLMALVLVLPCCFVIPANLVYLHGDEYLKIQVKNMLFSGYPSRLFFIILAVYCNVQMNLEAQRIWGKEYLCTKGYYFKSKEKET